MLGATRIVAAAPVDLREMMIGIGRWFCRASLRSARSQSAPRARPRRSPPRAYNGRRQARTARLLQLVRRCVARAPSLSAVLLGAPVIEAGEHHRQVRIGAAGDRGEIARQGRLQALPRPSWRALELARPRRGRRRGCCTRGRPRRGAPRRSPSASLGCPFGGATVVAEAKVDPAELLRDARASRVSSSAPRASRAL